MKIKHNAVTPIIAALIVMLVTAFATAQRSAQGADQGIDRLPGSWLAEITTPIQGSFPGLFTFTRDGALIGTESPGPFESPAHGNWVARGRDVAYTFLVLFGTSEGAGQNNGSAKVVGTLHFNARSGGWSGPFRIELLDTEGHVLFSNSGTIQLTRIAIEALD